MLDKLGMSATEVEGDFRPEDVTRVIEPRSKIVNEVIVTFASPHIRDSIKSSGYKLGGQRAGLRIEIPNFLRSDFQVLQSVSYQIKMAHAGVKRSVKFDDEAHGLMLDLQIPGQDWRRIRPDQARAARDLDPKLRTGPLELSGSMISDTIRSRTGTSFSTASASSSSGTQSTPHTACSGNALRS